MNRSERVAMWVRSFGVTKLAKEFRIGQNTIHAWITNNLENRKNPSTEFVKGMIRLSREYPFLVGPLTYEDFWGEV